MRTAARVLGGSMGVVALLSMSALASEDDAVRQDAMSYAAAVDVPVDEAARRLRLQALVGELDERLRAEVEDIYAGLWILHQPDLRVEVRFSDVARGAELLEALAGELLAAGLVAVGEFELPLVELEAVQEAAVEAARAFGVPVDASLDLTQNRAELSTTDPVGLEQAIEPLLESYGRHLRVQQVERLSEPAQAQQPLRGGRRLSTCTSGFTVRRSGTNELGALTAAHCGNAQTYWDTFQALPFRSERYEREYDVQWHSVACNMTVPNEFDSDSSVAGGVFRAVLGTRGRSQQSVGQYVCKNGRTTNRTCGFITSLSVCPSYVPSCRSRFIRVREQNWTSNNPRSMAEPGDSGGPFYIENTAVGITSGRYTTSGDAIYMAIDYASTLGVSVLTSNGGVSRPTASISCQASAFQISCWASAQRGVAPYTYQWSYFGDAASFSSSGSSATADYWPSGQCTESSYNFFSVQVTDSCGDSSFASDEPLCGCSDPFGRDCIIF